MKFDLAYGDGNLELYLPEDLDVEVLLPRNVPGLANPLKATEEALSHPVGTPPLLDMLKAAKPRKITVVVNDETRPTPYEILFPPLLKVFQEAGIEDRQVTFVIATGIHEPHSKELNEKTYGREMTERFNFISHIATDRDSLVDLGLTSSGYRCLINRHAVEADFLITIGVVMPHYFAGYSGGRKSILPGLAGHETVSRNHARMIELLDYMPPVDENPVSLEMIEVARKTGVNFIINVVTNDKKQVVAICAGDLVDAWRKAVDISAQTYETPFSRHADLTITCACGYPRDVNVYQAQKALDHAEKVTCENGEIIWVGKCQEGHGEKVFEKWLAKKLPIKELMATFRQNFELGGHKAYAIAKTASRNKIILISDLTQEEAKALNVGWAANLQDAVNAALKRLQPGATIAVMPYGSLTLPVYRPAK